MMKTRNGSNGFTIIELILVVGIIGILAIVSIPNYINLTSISQTNATKSIAAALSVANADNYASRILSATNGIAIKNCNSASGLLQNGLPSGYTITSLKVSANTTVSCTLKGPTKTSATFIATGIL
jgi:type IV pilus assembly protein PilA